MNESIVYSVGGNKLIGMTGRVIVVLKPTEQYFKYQYISWRDRAKW